MEAGVIFRFVGQYTNGHTTIAYGGVTFEGHEPAEVTAPEWIARLSKHPEFEVVDLEEATAPKRGRPKKDAV